jgi:two-component system response regulator YesN
LSRRFREETGQTFTDYLIQIRIKNAKEMLSNPKYKIGDIAAKVNLGNVSNFSKIFKKHEGITPGQYRDSLGKGNLGL